MSFDSFVYKVYKKKYINFLAILIIFFAFQNRIIEFTKDYLLIPSDFSNKILDTTIIISCALAIMYALYIPTFRGYRLSFGQSAAVFFVIIAVLSIYSNSDDNVYYYLEDSILNWEYIWYFILPLIVFYTMAISMSSYRYLFKKSENVNSNILYNDSPIEDFDNDNLGYREIVERLALILKGDKHKSAVAVGLIAPWGNGKSSVLGLLRKNIQNEIDFNNDLILIDFYPNLNIKEDDLIGEFFYTLSNEIEKYSGRLSNHVIAYARKLSGIYKAKNIPGIFEKHISKIGDSPAREFYEKINNQLIDLDKKIIVLVDDLDRLNDKEILQVLKLIRNTADFSNMIFVVAMDKEYTLSVLKSNKEILDTRFLEKFFQLEVNLPKIDERVIYEEFEYLIRNSILRNNTVFIARAIESLRDEKNLFKDYVRNIRDSKRIVNQLVFDYPLLKDELNMTDFFNFTFFKLKFPGFLKRLSNNPREYLELSTRNNVYTLIKGNDDDNNEGNHIAPFGTIDDLYDIDLVDLNENDLSYLENYKLFNELIKKPCTDNISNLDCKDYLLLLKTLVYLFGDRNTQDSLSIRNASKFQMLIQQKANNIYLLEKEFIDLINTDNISEAHQILEGLLKSKKGNQLLDRLRYYDTDNTSTLNSIIKILVYMLEKEREYNLYEADILRELARYVDLKFLQSNESLDVANWIDENIIQDKFLSVSTKILLLEKIQEVEYNTTNRNWGLDKLIEDYFPKRITRYFKEYLDGQDKLWEFDDYTFYQLYFSAIKTNGVNKTLMEIAMEFWATKNIELLCVQTVNTDMMSIVAFKISNEVSRIFGSVDIFIEFVSNHKDHNKPAIKEFIKFFDLCKRREFKGDVFFTFRESKLMKEKVAAIKSDARFGKDIHEGKKQLFFETDCLNLQNDWQENHSRYTKEDFLNLQFTIVDNKLSIFMTTTKEGIEHLKNHRLPFLLNRIRILEEKEYNLDFKKKDFKEDNNLLPEESDHYFKLISEQPKN